jgi:hypothetical protein
VQQVLRDRGIDPSPAIIDSYVSQRGPQTRRREAPACNLNDAGTHRRVGLHINAQTNSVGIHDLQDGEGVNLSATGVALAATCGLVLGTLAWGEARTPVLAALLPIAISLCRSRLQAFALAMAYACALLRFTAALVGTWFGDNLLIGVGAVAIYGIVTGSAWSLGWTASAHPFRKAWAVITAWAAALLPPAAIGAPGHALIAWGFLLPGSAWWGVGLSVAVPAVVAYLVAWFRPPRTATLVGFAGAAFLLSMWGLVRGGPETVPPRAAVAMTTHWGRLSSMDAALQRIEDMGRRSALEPAAGAAAVIWPESSIGRYDPAYFPVLSIEVLRAAAKTGTTHVIGMDLPLPGEQFLNSAVAFYPDGRTATATARQPAPIALWKPWRTEGNFIANWRASNLLRLGQGDTAAVIFCYEEFFPTFYLLNEALNRPSVYLALSNTWAAEYRAADDIQRRHSEGVALLFGKPYLRAVNRPPR